MVAGCDVGKIPGSDLPGPAIAEQDRRGWSVRVELRAEQTKHFIQGTRFELANELIMILISPCSKMHMTLYVIIQLVQWWSTPPTHRHDTNGLWWSFQLIAPNFLKG